MNRVLSSALATSFALAIVLVGVATTAQTAPSAAEARPVVSVASVESTVPGVPAEALPREGQCRIWYDELSPGKQPAAMECEHAHWLARQWGGRVIATTAAGSVEQASYEGRNDFTGVPEAALPHRGYCRAWVDGLDVAAQPAESDCRTARTQASVRGGRVLFMPL